MARHILRRCTGGRTRKTTLGTQIPGLAGRTRDDFARRWRLVFAWQVVVQLIGAAAVVPLAGWLLNRIVARAGSPVISNFDLARFVLSPWGAVFVLVALVASVAFHTTQFAGYTWIAGHAIARRPLTLWNTVGSVWARIGLLVEIGLRMFARMLLIALPFVALGGLLWFTTLRGHDVNYLLAERPPEWRRAVFAAGVLGSLYAFLVLRQFAYWIFTMPLAMFGERATAHVVLATSERMLQGRLLRTIAPLVGWWVGLSVGAAALFWLGRRMTDLALTWAGMEVHRVLPLVAVFLAVSFVFGFVYSTLQFAGHQFLITRTYAERTHGTLALPAALDDHAERIGRRQGKAVTVALVGATVLALGIGGVLLGKLDLRGDVDVTAHRGASLHAPENTLAAFRDALAAGADCVELDVQRTRDGHVVVIHDGDLMRVGGDPRRVRDLTLAELQAIDVGARHGSQFAGERVPTLQEVIESSRGRLRLNVELKYNVADRGLAPAVVELLRRERMVADSVITSLDHAALRQVERLAPEIATGLIVTAAVGNVVRADTDFVSLSSARAQSALVRRLHAAGKTVHVWTVNDAEVMLRMIERGVDNVITDDPARLVRLLRQRNALSTAEKLGLGLRVLFIEAPSELADERAVPAL
ncbi:MAG: ugpQ [Steroidobacteraceae bacterium]|nr:ugpQ [Steroidobacteraceae bacterium]